jgi:histidine kinase 2/3/4 (cytokinin receptor)
VILMSCTGGGAGVFVKFSRLFVKRHRWELVKMSINCKLSGSNGTSQESFKLRKSKEVLHETNSARKWKRKFLLLWFLGVAVTIGSIWLLFSFDSGALGRKGQSLDSCEEGAQVLLRHFNVSKNQLHALGSLFSDSDQVLCL